MDEGLSQVLKSLKHTFLISFIVIACIILLLTNLLSDYEKNIFEISLSDIPMKCYYQEKLHFLFFDLAGDSSYNSVNNKINRIQLNDSINLKVDEYEVYYKNGNRKKNNTGWSKTDKYMYIKTTNRMQLQIKKGNKIIYDGDYTEDISKYIHEIGRYYIHIYIRRNVSFLLKDVTHISFNVIVGDTNEQ